MTSYGYERLSAQDSSFLIFEGPNTHMHIGGTTIFDAGPLAGTDGGLDIELIRRYVAARLHAIPKYRQKLHYIPIENAPAWVDDAHLNIDYHVRHASLPRPGTDEQLKSLAARVMSQKLDRSKPLWELWVVEGLRDGRFALILKTHHSVVDGVSGVDLIGALMRPTPDATIPEPPEWEPRRIPTTREFLEGEVRKAAESSLEIGAILQNAWSTPETVRSKLAESFSAVWKTLDAGLRPPAETPLNVDVGPYRRFDWATHELSDIKAIKNALGGSINDVVLAITAGAIGRFLRHRKTKVRGLDYRVVVPVSMHAPKEDGSSGNHVSAWMLSLPIAQADPRKRLAEVCRTTNDLRSTKQEQGIEVITQIAEYAAPIMTLGVRLAAAVEPYNMIITNVPGPQQPLYLLGAPMVAGYPQVPLFIKQGLAVALLSYAGRLHWGFNADWDLVPDLGKFKEAIDASFNELLEAAQQRREANAGGASTAIQPPAGKRSPRKKKSR